MSKRAFLGEAYGNGGLRERNSHTHYPKTRPGFYTSSCLLPMGCKQVLSQAGFCSLHLCDWFLEAWERTI